MDAAIHTLLLVIAASRLDGTKVLVSIPEGTFYSIRINYGGRKRLWLELWILQKKNAAAKYIFPPASKLNQCLPIFITKVERMRNVRKSLRPSTSHRKI